MNKRGDIELGKLINFIIVVVILVVIVAALFIYFRPNLQKFGKFGESVTNALDNTGLSDIFTKTPTTPGAMTQEQKDKASAQKYMDGLFLEANQLSSGIETFDERFCTQDLVNRFKTASVKYEEYTKNCADTKSKYYQGCRDDNKTTSQNQVDKIKIIEEKCKSKLGDINKQVNELSPNVKALLDDAEKYEKLGNYNMAIEKLKAYIAELEKDKEKNKNLINEAYIKLIRDYMILGKNYYKDAFSIFKNNENLKILMPNEYKIIVLELAEPIDCETISYDNCPSLNNQIELNVLNTKVSVYMQKEDKLVYKRIGCFRYADSSVSQCVACRFYNSCGDYDKNLFNSVYWIENCKNDPCGFGPCKLVSVWYKAGNNDCEKL
ncbi:MAG: hypothetical protein NT139_02560 [Candidatus Woesearchaeota archaeon]|nr:hypothetical protein [Candidatus Woesearchaeota archaeon]